MEIDELKNWGLNNERPLVIAGPCSAETEEQVLSTALQLDANKVHLYRAGIWKPRTRPNSFEGVGNIGLEWLKKVKQQTGMKVCTEVANVKHVYEALKAGIDVLWIGARTSANPFAVQEIADALKGVNIPILVKNPVNPDLSLWIGAIERFHCSGIEQIGAIHRGFSYYGKSKYRNTPHWQIALDLKREMPEIPLISDPSHITGNSDYIAEVSQKAMDLNFDGLMIETHINPTQAWSDAKQQITPKELNILLNNLVLRNQNIPNTIFSDTLEELRAKIDVYDNEIMETIAARMDIVDNIGKWKKANNISIYQSSRFEQIIQSVITNAQKFGLTENFMINIFKAIHEESINKQTTIINSVVNEKALNL